jgi:hypothetical protein
MKNVLITGCTSYGRGRCYFHGVITLLISVVKYASDVIDEVIVFDFGLEDYHVKILEDFNFNIKIIKLPDDVLNWDYDLLTPYLYKSYVMANIGNHVNTNDNVLFLDAGVCFVDNPTCIFDIIKLNNFFIVEHDDQITRPWITDETIKIMNVTDNELDLSINFGGIVGFVVNNYSSDILKTIFNYMIDPEISNSLRHTQHVGHKLSQSISSIIFDRNKLKKQNHRKFAEHLGIKNNRKDQVLYVHRCCNFSIINNYFNVF